MTVEEEAAIVAFMKTLTDGYVPESESSGGLAASIPGTLALTRAGVHNEFF